MSEAGKGRGHDSPTRLLIIDDDVDLCEVMCELAEDKGYEVLSLNEGAAFIEAVEGFRPACIVMDLSLPDVDGIELMRTLGRKGCRVPIVLISSHPNAFLDEVAVLGKALGLEIRTALQKPFRTQAFLESI